MTLVIIPARYASTRLPGKPLEKIGRKTIIEHCVDRVLEAGLKPYVATDDQRIADVVPDYAVMTGEQPTGTDRVAEAAEIIDPEGKHEFVVNVQGDQPFLDHALIRSFSSVDVEFKTSILTAFCPFRHVHATEFRRRIVNAHIGLYGFNRATLRLFHATAQTEMEKIESLEPWRFGMPEIDAWHFYSWPSMPLEINTPADLAHARQIARCLS
jgi:3-deoxy-manno-octulosonate cytidylyltransferase (CMP-KDO synthetase)